MRKLAGTDWGNVAGECKSPQNSVSGNCKTTPWIWVKPSDDGRQDTVRPWKSHLQVVFPTDAHVAKHISQADNVTAQKLSCVSSSITLILICHGNVILLYSSASCWHFVFVILVFLLGEALQPSRTTTIGSFFRHISPFSEACRTVPSLTLHLQEKGNKWSIPLVFYHGSICLRSCVHQVFTWARCKPVNTGKIFGDRPSQKLKASPLDVLHSVLRSRAVCTRCRMLSSRTPGHHRGTRHVVTARVIWCGSRWPSL